VLALWPPADVHLPLQRHFAQGLVVSGLKR
jgi:hypothetical protein